MEFWDLGEGMFVKAEDWADDVDAMLTAIMYGLPPGGWSGARGAEFLDKINSIEASLREWQDKHCF